MLVGRTLKTVSFPRTPKNPIQQFHTIAPLPALTVHQYGLRLGHTGENQAARTAGHTHTHTHIVRLILGGSLPVESHSTTERCEMLRCVCVRVHVCVCVCLELGGPAHAFVLDSNSTLGTFI